MGLSCTSGPPKPGGVTQMLTGEAAFQFHILLQSQFAQKLQAIGNKPAVSTRKEGKRKASMSQKLFVGKAR